MSYAWLRRASRLFVLVGACLAHRLPHVSEFFGAEGAGDGEGGEHQRRPSGPSGACGGRRGGGGGGGERRSEPRGAQRPVHRHHQQGGGPGEGAGEKSQAWPTGPVATDNYTQTCSTKSRANNEHMLHVVATNVNV
eukprot:56731-Prorocentrum_minimum.AAC.1